MPNVPLSAPVAPQSVRVFCGYRLPALTRDAFLKELGDTFMPGTPYMLAPLGLAAYVAAALDMEAATGMPDEVALIVYSSLDAYTAARQRSLQGRMYTHSHAGVFDMQRSRGQFPGSPNAPDKMAAPANRWSWFLFDRPTDWQTGTTRLLFLQKKAATDPASNTLQQALHDTTVAQQRALEGAGIDQVVVVAGADYAAIWLHGPSPVNLDPSKHGLIADGGTLARDLVATPVRMFNRTEGVTITGPAAFSFRFVREPLSYL